MRTVALLLSLVVLPGCMIHSIWSRRMQRQCAQLKRGMTVEDAYRIMTVTTPYCEYQRRPGLPEGRTVRNCRPPPADHPTELHWQLEVFMSVEPDRCVAYLDDDGRIDVAGFSWSTTWGD